MTAVDIVRELDRLYTASVDRLKTAVAAYIADRTEPDPAWRKDGSFAYPEIRIRFNGAPSRTL